MSDPQIIKTPKGDRLAVIPLAEYERLRAAAAEAEDVRAYDEARHRLAAGEDKLVPAAIADRLLAGDNPVRVWRAHRGLKARALAQAAGISPAYLSQIERGEREGSLETLRRIAAALGVSLDDLAAGG
ncbi:MAG TPA: helix-turn-helix transcriptional regulator [Methylomirabilota bacterium]